MSDSAQEKTEQASAEKRKKARERGDVAQSRDLTGVAVLSATLLGLVLRHEVQAEAVSRCLASAIDCATADSRPIGDRLAEVQSAAVAALFSFVPVLLGAALAGGLASFLQVGPLLSGDPLQPKLERLDPVAGLRRMFLSLKSWIEVFKSLVKIAVVGGFAWSLLDSRMKSLLDLGRKSPEESLGTVLDLAIAVVVRVALAWLALAVLDLFYQRWQKGRDLRMSKDELKRENREQDGSPEVKANRKRAHEDVLAQADLARVLEMADVVIVNPTHYACALGYDPDDGAPRLIAKAKDHMARRIRKAAEGAGIPVRHDVGLARALHQLTVDETIPVELYEAVAITLDWVREVLAQRGELPHWEVENGRDDATSSGHAG